MDWDIVIDRNRDALKRILAMLVAMAGLAGADLASRSLLRGRATLPRHLHRTILRHLRSAEAAARRLVIIAARDLVLPPPRPRKAGPAPASIFVRPGETRTGIVLPYGVRPGDILPELARPRTAPRSLSLPLLDPLPRWGGRKRPAARGVLRISIPGSTERLPAPPPPRPNDLIDTTRLGLRLGALGRALDDLPRETRRFALWRARRDAAAARISRELEAAGVQLDPTLYGAGARNRKTRAARFPRISPLRPGRPPGSCRRSRYEVQEVLKDLHHFAFHALERRDTS